MSPSLPDPYINEGDWSALQRNFDKVASLLLETGGQSVGIRFGTGTLTFPAAGASSTVATVTHGLGRVPIAVVITGNGTGGPSFVVVQALSLSAASFTMQGGFLTGTAAGVTTVNVGWFAIG